MKIFVPIFILLFSTFLLVSSQTSQNYSCLELKTEYKDSCNCSHTGGVSNFVKSDESSRECQDHDECSCTDDCPQFCKNGKCMNYESFFDSSEYACIGEDEGCVNNSEYCAFHLTSEPRVDDDGINYTEFEPKSSQCLDCANCALNLNTTFFAGVITKMTLPIDKTANFCCPKKCSGHTENARNFSWTFCQCAPGCDPIRMVPGDGQCNIECNNEACSFDGGDCEGECATDCPWNWIGDGWCDKGTCLTETCRFDNGTVVDGKINGGDCNGTSLECAQREPDCNPDWMVPGDDNCNIECNNEACSFDGGDCEGECATDCPWNWIGDGQCNNDCNNEACH